MAKFKKGDLVIVVNNSPAREPHLSLNIGTILKIKYIPKKKKGSYWCEYIGIDSEGKHVGIYRTEVVSLGELGKLLFT